MQSKVSNTSGHAILGGHSRNVAAAGPQQMDFHLTRQQVDAIKAKLPKDFLILNYQKGEIDKFKQEELTRYAKIGLNYDNSSMTSEKNKQKKSHLKDKNKNSILHKTNKLKDNSYSADIEKDDKIKKKSVIKKKVSTNEYLSRDGDMQNEGSVSSDQFQPQSIYQNRRQAEKPKEKQKQKQKDVQKQRQSKQQKKAKQSHKQNHKQITNSAKALVSTEQIVVEPVYPDQTLMQTIPIDQMQAYAAFYQIPTLQSGLPRYIPLPVDYQPEGTPEQKSLRYQFGLINGPISQQPIPTLTQKQKNFCFNILHRLKNHKSSGAFRVSVDPIIQGVPDYYYSVYSPMDLESIHKKVKKDKYSHISQFHADINKIFLNSYKYNLRHTLYFQTAIQFQDYYHQLLKDAEIRPNQYTKQLITKMPKVKKGEDIGGLDYTQPTPIKKKKRFQGNYRPQGNMNKSQNLQKGKGVIKSKVYDEYHGFVSNSMVAENVSQFHNELYNTVSADARAPVKKNQNIERVQQIKSSWIENQDVGGFSQSLDSPKSHHNNQINPNFLTFQHSSEDQQQKLKQKQKKQSKDEKIQREKSKQQKLLQMKVKIQQQKRMQLEQQLSSQRQMRLEYQMRMYHPQYQAPPPEQMQQEQQQGLMHFKYDLNPNAQPTEGQNMKKMYMPPYYPMHPYYPHYDMSMMPENYQMHQQEVIAKPQMQEYRKVKGKQRNDDYNDDDEMPENRHQNEEMDIEKVQNQLDNHQIQNINVNGFDERLGKGLYGGYYPVGGNIEQQQQVYASKAEEPKNQREVKQKKSGSELKKAESLKQVNKEKSIKVSKQNVNSVKNQQMQQKAENSKQKKPSQTPSSPSPSVPAFTYENEHQNSNTIHAPYPIPNLDSIIEPPSTAPTIIAVPKTKNISKAAKTKKKNLDEEYRCSSEDQEFMENRYKKNKEKGFKQSRMKSYKESSNSAEVASIQKKRGRQPKNKIENEFSAQNSEVQYFGKINLQKNRSEIQAPTLRNQKSQKPETIISAQNLVVPHIQNQQRFQLPQIHTPPPPQPQQPDPILQIHSTIFIDQQQQQSQQIQPGLDFDELL